MWSPTTPEVAGRDVGLGVGDGCDPARVGEGGGPGGDRVLLLGDLVGAPVERVRCHPVVGVGRSRPVRISQVGGFASAMPPINSARTNAQLTTSGNRPGKVNSCRPRTPRAKPRVQAMKSVGTNPTNPMKASGGKLRPNPATAAHANSTCAAYHRSPSELKPQAGGSFESFRASIAVTPTEVD